MNTLSVFPLFAAWCAGVPIRIAHSHSTIIKGEGLRTLMKYGLRPFVKLFATHYAACSLAAAESLFGKAAAEGKVSLLKNAIDPSVFAFNADLRAQTRKKLGLTNELLIGHVGRFVYAKNHRFLIEIFHEMLKLQADCRLLLVGDGPLMPQIKEHVQALGLNGQVGFTGLQANVSAYYQAFDLFVMPSHYEGLPVVLLEAQAAGLPVIASPAIPAEAFVTGDHLSITLQEDVGHWARNSLAFAAAHVPGTRSDGSHSIIQSGYAVSEAAGTFLDFYDGLLIDR